MKKLLMTVFLFGAMSGVHAGTVNFSDGTFNPADYTQTFFADDHSVPLVVITSGQSLINGNLAPDWQVTFTQPGSAPLALLNSYQGFINTTFQYTPSSEGAIAMLDFSNDRYVAFGPAIDPILSTFSRVLLQQGGNFYVAAFADPFFRESWFTSSDSGLVASNFSELNFGTGVVDATQHPDFSTSGGLIEFGFASRFTVTNPNGSVLDGTFGFDNLSVTLNTTPEPATLLLLGMGLAGLAASRRRKAN